MIVEDTLPETGVMLSSLVKYLDENDAGPGFYQLAKDKGLLTKNATSEQKLDFWAGQVGAVYDQYKPRSTRGTRGQ